MTMDMLTDVKLHPPHPNSMFVPLHSQYSCRFTAYPTVVSFSSSSWFFIDRRWFRTSGRSRSHTADVGQAKTRSQERVLFSRSSNPVKSQTRETVNTPSMDLADLLKNTSGNWTYICVFR
jgi:hypothetical protein